MNRFFPSERVPLRSCWRRLGLAGQCCGILTLGLIVLTAAMMIQAGLGSGGSRVWADWGVVIMVGLIWSLGLAAASILPVAGYVLAGLWMGWHGVALMGTWTGTPLAGLLVIWWLGVGLTMLAWRGPKRKWLAGLLWLGMALGVGYLVTGPGGWSRLPGAAGDFLWTGRLLVGSGLAAAGWWLRPRLREWAWTEPSFGKVLGGSLMVVAVGLGASLWRDAQAAAGWAWGAVEGAGFAASLGWFWLGGLFAAGLVSGLETGGAWISRRWRVRGTSLSRPSPHLIGEGAGWILPGLWLLVTAVEWLATHEAAQQWAGQRVPGLLEGWLAWSPGWLRVAEAHRWAGITAVVLGMGLWWQGSARRQMMGRLNRVWGVAFLCIAAVAQALPGVPEAGHWGQAAWIGPVGILVGGGLFALLLALHDGRECEKRERAAGLWGVLALVAGMMLMVEGRSMGAWRESGGASALLGLVHLALPLVLYRWWTRGSRMGGELSFSLQVSLSAAGLLVVLPLLHRDTATVSQMAFCPLLWLPVLLWLRIRQPSLDTAAGTLAGGLLGSATVAAWSRPGLLLPEVPLFPWLNPPTTILTSMEVAARPFMNPTHFTLLLLMSTAGGLLGAMIFKAKPSQDVPLMPLLTDPAGNPAGPAAGLWNKTEKISHLKTFLS